MVPEILSWPVRYGHGVLRDPDPRFFALRTFCEVRPELKDSPIINLVKKTAEVAPSVLKEHGKASPRLVQDEAWLNQNLSSWRTCRRRIPIPMSMPHQVRLVVTKGTVLICETEASDSQAVCCIITALPNSTTTLSSSACQEVSFNESPFSMPCRLLTSALQRLDA